MSGNMTKILCECDSNVCDKQIEIPITEYDWIFKQGFIVIVDGCPRGPRRSDQLVERKSGYAIYKEPPTSDNIF